MLKIFMQREPKTDFASACTVFGSRNIVENDQLAHSPLSVYPSDS